MGGDLSISRIIGQLIRAEGSQKSKTHINLSYMINPDLTFIRFKDENV